MIWNKEKVSTKNERKNRGITLIALVITIIILLILAGLTIGTLTGSGLFKRAQEARFKTKMSTIAEQWDIQKMNLSINGESTEVYAGEILKKIIVDESLEIREDVVVDITKLLSEVGKTEEKYVMIHEGELYYVSQKDIKDNNDQVKWCEEIGIKIWEYIPPSKMGVVNGNYENVNDVYLCTPQLNTGFSKDTTRYAYDREGNLVPGNWINKKPDEDWYDYKNQKWANLYVESNGIESYYVWIPRYVYKKDVNNSVAGNERMDVKFIDVNNNYKDAETEEETTWEELQKQGYVLPEAFWWDANNNEVEDDGEQLPGYWMSKYQLSDLGEYVLDYNTAATVTSINVQEIKIKTDKIVAKYTYSVNGNILYTYECPNANEGQTEEEKQAPDHLIKGLAKGDKSLNVTALDEDGEVIGSMTRVYAVADVNEPQLKAKNEEGKEEYAFDPDTTFYVYWDEEGNEHNEIPIREKAPDEWYDYTIANWANIVTRNDGLETYYVWIPRYEYQLDATSNPQKSIVRFIKGTRTEATSGYKIPEAFWWDNDSDRVADEGEQLTGYWMTKYQLTAECAPRMDAEITAGGTDIKIGDITGTSIEEAGENARYEYYINGRKMTDAKGDSSKEYYIFKGLEKNKTYTINIIARNKNTNEYIAAVTKKIKTIAANEPELIVDGKGFNQECTYYVVYKEDGTEERTPISEKAPENWYDYSKQQWANIVTTNEGTETYFVWIPRYEYKLDATTNPQKSVVNFIDKEQTTPTKGYQIPEAFWWDNNNNGVHDEGEELAGYWMSKYQLK